MKIVTLTKEDFDEFSKNHKHANYLQTTMYGNLMELHGFKNHYIGFKNNSDVLIGSCLLLYRNIFMDYKYAYAPFGFLINYYDHNTVKQISDSLRKLLYKQKFISIKIDPRLICSRRDKKGIVLNYNEDINDILNNLNKSDFFHLGFNKYFETVKPRWNAVLNINEDLDVTFNNFSKQVKNKIRKGTKIGIFIEKTNDDISEFYDLVKKKYSRPLKYYENMKKSYGNNVEFYLAKLNPEKYLLAVKQDYENEEIKNFILNNKLQECTNLNKVTLINKKMASDTLLNIYKRQIVEATKLLKENEKDIILGAISIIKYNNEINLLIEGINKKYSHLNSNYYLKWQIIRKYHELGYKSFNLNAISGDFGKNNKYRGLNESKLGFNAQAVEYIGEFDLVINSNLYKVTQNKIINDFMKRKAE